MKKSILLLLVSLLFGNYVVTQVVCASEKINIGKYKDESLRPRFLEYEIVYPSEGKTFLAHAATNYNPTKVKAFYHTEFLGPYSWGEVFAEVYNNEDDAIQRLNENIVIERRINKDYTFKTYYNKNYSYCDTISLAGRQVIKRLLFTEQQNIHSKEISYQRAEQRIYTFTFREGKTIITICYAGSFCTADYHYKKSDELDISFVGQFIRYINSSPGSFLPPNLVLKTIDGFELKCYSAIYSQGSTANQRFYALYLNPQGERLSLYIGTQDIIDDPMVYCVESPGGSPDIIKYIACVFKFYTKGFRDGIRRKTYNYLSHQENSEIFEYNNHKCLSRYKGSDIRCYAGDFTYEINFFYPSHFSKKQAFHYSSLFFDKIDFSIFAKPFEKVNITKDK